MLTLSALGDAVPVAVNVTAPVTPAALADRVLRPGVGSRIQPPRVAIPLPSVVCTAPLKIPLLAAAANVITTPATGLPPLSVALTDGSAPESGWPAMPLKLAAPLTASSSALPVPMYRMPLAEPLWLASVTVTCTE